MKYAIRSRKSASWYLALWSRRTNFYQISFNAGVFAVGFGQSSTWTTYVSHILYISHISPPITTDSVINYRRSHGKSAPGSIVSGGERVLFLTWFPWTFPNDFLRARSAKPTGSMYGLIRCPGKRVMPKIPSMMPRSHTIHPGFLDRYKVRIVWFAYEPCSRLKHRPLNECVWGWAIGIRGWGSWAPLIESKPHRITGTDTIDSFR